MLSETPQQRFVSTRTCHLSVSKDFVLEPLYLYALNTRPLKR
jgi:hypothetical protein